MNTLIREALQRACDRDGLLNPSLLDAPFFADAVNLAKVVDGEAVIGEALQAMKQAKPSLFFAKDWSRLSDSEFSTNVGALLSQLKTDQAPQSIPKVDAAKMSAGEYEALSNLLRSNGYDNLNRSIVEEAARRQKEAANV